jgi:cytochrome c biogenesis protein
VTTDRGTSQPAGSLAAGRASWAPLDALARIGAAAWRLLIDVRFAVVLITLLALTGLVGLLVRQFRVTALDDPARYAIELAAIDQQWSTMTPFGLPVGPTLVDVFDRLGLFTVFSSPWFLLLMSVLTLSIVCCTLDRTPRLWRSVRDVRIEQPDGFFDPRLEHRALLPAAGASDPATEVAAAVRSLRFRVSRSVSADGATGWVYGDRNRYNKLATLLTHAGLVLFLVAGAVTVAGGFETMVFVGEGQSAPVQRVGTPGNLMIKVVDFDAPRRADGSFADFATDLAVYRDGTEVARQTIRVNDPLRFDGFTFHQNTFGPAVDLAIRDATGGLAWSGPVILAGQFLDRPQGFLTIPGTDVGLLVVLDAAADGSARVILQGVGAPAVDGSPGETVFLATVPVGAATDPAISADHEIAVAGIGSWTGIVVKNDPGQPLIWVAFGLLISGLVLTFYFPRRRAWARIEDGRVALVFIADRYVDRDREFEGLRARVSEALGPSG